MQERIRTIRKVKKLTLAEFAERLGLSNQAVSNWEHGSPVPESRIKAICQEFEINEEWLRTGNGKMDAEKPEPPKANLEDFKDSEVMLEAVMRAYSSLSPEYKTVAQHVIRELSKKGADPKRVIESLDKFRRGKDDDNATA